MIDVYTVTLHGPKVAMAYITETVQEAAVLVADWVHATRESQGVEGGRYWATMSVEKIQPEVHGLMEEVSSFPFPAPMYAKWAAQKARKGAQSADEGV